MDKKIPFAVLIPAPILFLTIHPVQQKLNWNELLLGSEQGAAGFVLPKKRCEVALCFSFLPLVPKEPVLFLLLGLQLFRVVNLSRSPGWPKMPSVVRDNLESDPFHTSEN